MNFAAAPAGLLAALALLPIGSARASGADLPALAPYQMVRSLQLLQDRIADGDQAALPMQRKMIEMIDARMNDAATADFSDRRNFEALMIYGMSGGNPRTMAAVTTHLELDAHDKAMADGLAAYFHGEMGKAAALLSALTPGGETPRVGAFLALIKGSALAADHPEEALALLDQARLLAPGTLVEEAALRRSISVATTLKDPVRFLRASEQYVRRFLRSPYASHFADGFVNGVVDLQDRFELTRIEPIVSAKNEEQQMAVYLRIARKSAILGHTGLAELASARAAAVRTVEGTGPDPRAELYNALSSVASESIEDVSSQLASIDRESLSPRDVRLLEAATAVVNGVLSTPPPPSEAEMKTAAEPVGEPAAAPVRKVKLERIPAPSAASRPAATAAAENAAEPELTPKPGTPAAPTPEDAIAASGEPAQPAVMSASAEDDLVLDTRRKLAEIDELLEKTAK